MLEAVSALIIWLLVVAVLVQFLFSIYLAQRLQDQRQEITRLQQQVAELSTELDDSALIIARQRDRIQLHVMRELALSMIRIFPN